jgi:glycine cleavage system T protein (aminomethyltransferase)
MVTFEAPFDLRALRRDYGDVFGEAISCRSAAALFDFSFMHRIRVHGPRAAALIALLTPRRIDGMPPGRIRHALALDRQGHVLVDLTIWRLNAETFEIFLPPTGAHASLQAAADSTTSVCNLSDETAILAVQGPTSLRALAPLAPAAQLRALPYFGHADTSVAGVACRVGRLGYTGERGFELVLPAAARESVWAALAAHAQPAGFAAADILRIEAGFPLFTNEFRFPVTPAQLGLERFANGGAATTAAEEPPRLICFQAHCDQEPILWRPSANAQFPPRPGTLLVTSACRSVSTGRVIGLGYAAGSAVDLANANFQQIRRTFLPVYDPGKRRPRGTWRDDLSPAPFSGSH